MTFLNLVLALSLTVGETYSNNVRVAGIGELAMPPGEWILEYAITPDEKDRTPDVYVFKKVGTRLERLTFQKFGPHIARPIGAYFDSIGDSISNGIPAHVMDYNNEHEYVDILRPVKYLGNSERCMVGSFIYTSETTDPWMSHAFVCDCDGWVFVGIHASPFAISPDTIANIYRESQIQRGTRN